MAITATWFDDTKKIIYWEFGKSWTWDEFKAAVSQSDEMSKDCDHPVDLILDFTNSTYTFTLNPSQIHYGMSVASAQGGIVVLVSDRRVVQSLVTIFMRVYPKLGKHMHIVGKVPDAVEIIQTYRTDAL